MSSWIKKIWLWAFPPQQIPAPVEQPPVSIPPVETQPDFELISWVGRAIEITQAFEGNSPWANITGNFDGAGLTCGALGWTVKWNNQQPLVKKFVLRFGIDNLKQYMPTTWKWYWDLTQIQEESKAIAFANTISNGKSSVFQPYRSELSNFWSSKEMILIQKETAAIDMGSWAKEQCFKIQKHFNLSSPQFFAFAYYFDQAVLNGTGKNPEIYEASSINFSDIFSWMDKETGYGQEDFTKNMFHWRKMITSDASHLAPDQELLFKLGYLRARRARSEFDTITMSRRGILSLGSGYLNGQFWNLSKELSL
jgi:hypothetical protein